MSIAVQYENDDDRESAERIANFIDNNYSFSSFTVTGDSINYSSFDGVLVVGGQNANSVYQDFVNEGAFPALKCNTGEDDPYFFDDAASEGVVTEMFLYQGAIVQGLAGCTASNTSSLAEWYIGQASAQQTPFNLIGAGIDEFINRILEEQGSDETVEDPSDGVVESGPQEPNWKTLVVERPRSAEGDFVSGAKKYTLEVSGQIELGTKSEDKLVAGDSVVSGGVAEGHIGVSGKDSWEFTGSLEDVEYEGNDDLLINITDDSTTEIKTYDSSTSTVKDGNQTGGRTDQSFFEEFVEAYKNPFATLENTTQVGLTIVLAYLLIQAFGFGENVT